MRKIVNPFIVTGKIDPAYFCDREEESARLIRSLDNGNNLVIISPRRLGKTGLIQFCYEKPEWKKTYYTFFIDILHTSSLREFTYTLGKEIYETLLPRSKRMTQLFMQTLKSISGKFGFDPLSNTPTFSLELGDIDRPEYTLTHIQKINNCHFIFAGSERHMMQNMFVSASRPFYHSADMLELSAIPDEKYIPFIVGNFNKFGKSISEDTAKRVYALFQGHTYYIQKTFNEGFADTENNKECTISILQQSIDRLLSDNDTIFREILSNIPERQKEVLYAIAKDGEARQVTSSAFIKRHRLASASAVQSAIKKLLDKDFITEINKTYSLTDRLFALWIKTVYGTGFRL